MQRGSNRTGITSHLEEGIMAYAAEMADMEERRRISWEVNWASIRERAKMVLERILNGDKNIEEGIQIPKLTVEIEVEEGHDYLDDISDTD